MSVNIQEASCVSLRSCDATIMLWLWLFSVSAPLNAVQTAINRVLFSMLMTDTSNLLAERGGGGQRAGLNNAKEEACFHLSGKESKQSGNKERS